MNEKTIYDIPLNDIEVAETNVRRTQPDKDLDQLEASIRKHDLIHPVLLKGAYGKPPYKLIVGQRRFLAHQNLGKKTIRATFAGNISDVQASIRSLAENMLRVELNYADAAEAVTTLYKHFRKDEKKVSEETGMSIPRIRRLIFIEERASDKMKQKLRRREVKVADVQRVLRAAAGDIKKADRLLDLMEKYKLSKFQKDRLVEYGESHPAASVDKIYEESTRPKLEKNILVKLSDKARSGLEKASEKMAMEPDELAAYALEDWLSAKGFIIEEKK